LEYQVPDSLDLTYVIALALETFSWSNYGYDDMAIDITDPALDIKDGLTSHLVEAVQSTLDYS
jgi:hypothetical protein